jgi:manganese oxidase
MDQHKAAIARRSFLKMAGLAGPGIGLAACTTRPTAVNPNLGQPANSSTSSQISPTVSTAATATPMQDHNKQTPPQQGASDDMDAMHEAGVRTFLDGIGSNPAFWGTPLAYREEDGFKVFEVTCSEIDWDTGSGNMVKAMAYNGTVPGPEIRIVQGDKVRVVVTNGMSQSTVVHFHGVLVPNNMDGVPFITQPPIKPGETFTYEFEARNPGSHMYHSHHNATEQVTKGLLGAFIIEPENKDDDPEADAEYTLILNDAGIGITINGKGFPYTQPILARKGEKIRIRYMNEGLMIHPMHLHGLEQLVFAKDGWTLPQPYYCDTVNIAPGERYDVLVDCHTPGAWAFHCHILSHAESAMGMFGMVTAMVVEE